MRHARLHESETSENQLETVVVSESSPLQDERDQMGASPTHQTTHFQDNHPRTITPDLSMWQRQTLTATDQHVPPDVTTRQPGLREPNNSNVDHPQNTNDYYSVPSDLDIANMDALNDPFPVPGTSVSEVSPLSGHNVWGASLMSPGPAWLVGYDFDLDALNTSVSTTINNPQPLFQYNSNFQVNAPIVHDQPSSVVEFNHKQKSAMDLVCRGWFSRVDRDEEEDDTRGGNQTGQMTPVCTTDGFDVGDNFRNRITARLKAPTNDEPLPSTKFLVCLPPSVQLRSIS
jgi:hypothetical protein